jgi:CDP-diacylglycerol--serine O-phosphatidyltransferase
MFLNYDFFITLKETFLRGHWIPNTLTLFSLSMGFQSIYWSFLGNFSQAALFIFIGGFLDLMDGRMARKLGILSPLGEQLDSLADMVTSGVAPAVALSTSRYMSSLGSVSWIIVSLYVLAGAWRLGRFTTCPNIRNPLFSLGLPIPVAAAFLMFPGILFSEWNLPWSFFGSILYAFYVLILSFLMIGNVWIFAPKKNFSFNVFGCPMNLIWILLPILGILIWGIFMGCFMKTIACIIFFCMICMGYTNFWEKFLDQPLNKDIK